jgi:hypothetical protein
VTLEKEEKILVELEKQFEDLNKKAPPGIR